MVVALDVYQVDVRFQRCSDQSAEGGRLSLTRYLAMTRRESVLVVLPGYIIFGYFARPHLTLIGIRGTFHALQESGFARLPFFHKFLDAF
jgi:hypothetical protein